MRIGRWLVATMASAASAAALADAPPPIRLERPFVLVLNFSYMAKSPDLVLSLVHLDKDGLSFRADTAISATDVKLNRGGYGAEDFENAEDLQKSHHIFTRFFDDESEHAGGTVLLASAEVFEELRSKGSTAIDVVDIPGEKGMVYTPGVVYERKNFRGTLQKVGIETIRVLVDDEPVMLPVLHAKGTLKARELTRDYEFWWLNDPAARLLLHYKSEDYVEYRVVRIDRPEPSDGGPLTGKVEAPQDGKHAFQARKRFQIDGVVSDGEIMAFHQRQPEVASEVGVLEIRFVEGSRRENNGQRCLPAICVAKQLLAQRGEETAEGFCIDVTDEIRKRT